MPKEIEELLSRHPGVSQAYAVGVPDERWGETGCVWVVREAGAAVTEEEILELCRGKLARFKVPKHVLFLTAEELPTTPTGKVRKFELVRKATQLLQT
jgi:fatty-acyl-CoA synthase